MTTDDKTKTNVDINKAPTKTRGSIFSPKIVEKTVKSFVLAYLRGTITINFASAHEIQSRETMSLRITPYSEALKKEIQDKITFSDLISICVGKTAATEEERQSAINNLFDWILAFRSSNRIVGTFEQYSTEERLSRLERRFDNLTKLVKDISDYLRGGVTSQ